MNRTIENPIVKDRVTFLQTAEETKGSLTEIEVVMYPGGGNPLHYHKTYAETFTAVEGQLSLGLSGGAVVLLQPGEVFTVAPNTPHRFFNATDVPLTFRVKIQPARPGFEQALRIIYGLAADGRTNSNSIPLNPLHTAVIVQMSDINLPGIYVVFQPVLGLVAFIARLLGVHKRLVERYAV